MGRENTAFHERTHLHAFAGFEKQAARPDELERVPLDGLWLAESMMPPAA